MNPYAAFLSLLPRQVKSIGTVYAVDTDGTITITGIDGSSRFIAKGGSDSFIAGDTVLVVDGIVVSKLPPTQIIVSQSLI